MQIVSWGDNFYDMLDAYFLGGKEAKYYQFVDCWISPESDKG